MTRRREPVPRRRPPSVAAVVRLVRPRQWSKNLLVAAAPLADGTLDDPADLRATLVALVALVLASSAVYVHNDLVDRESDARHPRKRERPIASGEVGVGLAAVLWVVLAVLAVGVSALGSGAALVAAVLAYVGVSLTYSGLLKHRPYLDIAIIAVGFLLRVLAGAAATATEPSMLLLVTVGAVALFVAAGKRYSEVARVGSVARPSLQGVSVEFLRTLWVMGGTVAIVCGVLWGIEVAADSIRPAFSRASVGLLVLMILRYAWWIDRREAEAPEEVVLRDHVLLGCAVAWTLLFGAGVGSI